MSTEAVPTDVGAGLKLVLGADHEGGFRGFGISSWPMRALDLINLLVTDDGLAVGVLVHDPSVETAVDVLEFVDEVLVESREVFEGSEGIDAKVTG